MSQQKLLAVWIFMLLGLLGSSPSYANTLTVNSITDFPDPPRLTLREAVLDSRPGDTICFDKSLNGRTILLSPRFSTGLEVRHNLSITAADLPDGVTIDGNRSGGSNYSVFFVWSGAANFSNLTIRGAGDNGVFGFPNTILNLTDCKVLDNGGGGIGAQDLTLVRCTVSNNVTRYSAAGVYARGTVSISDSTISDNIANGFSGHGGGIVASGNVTISHSAISNNTVTQGAYGGIYIETGNAIISNCMISNNIASRAGGLYLGGGGVLDNCNFTGNRAYSINGAIQIVAFSPVTVQNCTIDGNRAGECSGLNCSTYGNAEVTVRNCKFRNNVVESDILSTRTGCVMLQDGRLRVQQTTITGNHDRGILNSNRSSETRFDVEDCSICDNVGGIRNESDMRISRCTISGNSSMAEQEGGGITALGLNGGTTTIEESTIENNQGERGGGVLALAVPFSGHGNAILNYCTVSGNTAVSYGGGIAALSPGRSIALTVNHCTISENNTNNGNGGGVYFDPYSSDESRLTLIANTVTENHASLRGGGVSLRSVPAMVKVNNNLVAGNTDKETFAPDVSGSVTSEGYNLVGMADGSEGWVDTDQTGTIDNPLDPIIGLLANNGGPTKTHALLKGSPAIDTGNPTLAGTRDQRGVIRDKLPDIGSYEREVGFGSSGIGKLFGRVEQRAKP